MDNFISKKQYLKFLHYKLLLHFNLPIIPLYWNNSKNTIGEYFYEYIVLSERYLQFAPFEEMEDTLRHELAHHYQYVCHGYTNHDKLWKKCAKFLGAKPEPYSDLPEKYLPKSKYSAICPKHGVIEKFNRMGKKWENGHYCCGKCGADLEIQKNY